MRRNKQDKVAHHTNVPIKRRKIVYSVDSAGIDGNFLRLSKNRTYRGRSSKSRVG